jgi:hypothetical protein
MTGTKWSFDEFVDVLRRRSETLSGRGAAVELDVQSAARSSVRLRVECGKRLGELTVWGDGSAHMVVVDLGSGNYVYERDGVSLAEESVERALKGFFGKLEPGQ